LDDKASRKRRIEQLNEENATMLDRHGSSIIRKEAPGICTRDKAHFDSLWRERARMLNRINAENRRIVFVGVAIFVSAVAILIWFIFTR
jgi:hypothetical protein